MLTSELGTLALGHLFHHRYQIQAVLKEHSRYRLYQASDRDRFNQPCWIAEWTSGTPLTPVQGHLDGQGLPPGGARPLAHLDYQTQRDHQTQPDHQTQRDHQAHPPIHQHFQQLVGPWQSLQHPQLPAVLAAFAQDERVYLIQTALPRFSYRHLLRQRGPLKEREIRRLLHQVLPVLGYLHRQGIIYGHLAPERLLLPVSDLAQVDLNETMPILSSLGFLEGITQSLYPPLPSSAAHPASSLPRHRGRPGYAPPEQLHTGYQAEHSDLYALAMTCVVLMSAQEPQQLLNPQTLDWTWPKTLNLSASLEAVLRRMLAWKPSDRFGQAEAVLKALDKSRSGMPRGWGGPGRRVGMMGAGRAKASLPSESEAILRSLAKPIATDHPGAVVRGTDLPPVPSRPVKRRLAIALQRSQRRQGVTALPPGYPADLPLPQPQPHPGRSWAMGLGLVLGLWLIGLIAFTLIPDFRFEGVTLGGSGNLSLLGRWLEPWSQGLPQELPQELPQDSGKAEDQVSDPDGDRAGDSAGDSARDSAEPSSYRQSEAQSQGPRTAEPETVPVTPIPIDLNAASLDSPASSSHGTLSQSSDQVVVGRFGAHPHVTYSFTAQPGQSIELGVQGPDTKFSLYALTTQELRRLPTLEDGSLDLGDRPAVVQDVDRWQGFLPQGDRYLVQLSGYGDYQLNIELIKP